MDRVKFYKFLKKNITPDTMRVILLFTPLLIILVERYKKNELSLDKFLDTSILTTFLFLILCNIVVIIMQNWIGRKSEDSIKLTDRYLDLIRMYPREELLSYNGVKFPILVLTQRNHKDPAYIIDFDHSKKDEKYILPHQIAQHSDFIMKAHNHSYTYNQMCLRLNDLKINTNRLTLSYSQTYYYDSLITNRAMDYEWENGKSNRKIYEPGPFFHKLSESRFSNHLGFNGFIETSDRKIIFVKRNVNLSIGKNTIASSIGASFKVEYGLDDDRNLTLAGLRRAIRNEIYDELKIDLPDEKLENGIFSFYRDLVEGGKPQFLFYYKLSNTSSTEFEKNFKKIANIKAEAKKGFVDGSRFYYLSCEELKKSVIMQGGLVLPNQKKLKLTASSSASVVLFLKYLENDA